VKARFVVGKTEKLDDGLCRWTLVAAAKGKAEALGESLAQGDVLVVAHALPFEVRALGTAAVAHVPFTTCAVRSRPAPEKTVVRAGAAPRLTWAGGAMNAHLDVGPPLSKEAYMGRLYGTAGVAEHDHPASWEILFALEASGTFTLAGQARRLGPGEIVFVPPGTKHSWSPDPGAPLTAVQMYVPPGPEQRFKQLAGAK
jgi:quercetin dioxygenase-like cupin family protein